VIGKLNVREGMFVMPQQEIMSLADLSSIWILAEVFESQADWVKQDQYADVKLSYLPGRKWEGKVEYIYPSLNPKTRTLKVRLRFDNPDEALKPNMFADVIIYGGARKNIPIIPREALIRTGKDERVILSMGKGRYQPRNVKAGIESGDWVEIIEGLVEGDTVVTSGQFLIDSEASLKASLARMMDAGDKNEKSMMKMEMKKIMGKGTLREVLLGENKISMSHDPIPELGWPDMTMYFKVKADVSLEGFKPDQAVEFELEKGDDGYVIKNMKQVK
jgi:Cu(I)/Ag(I) efflux system membrane fusion protein